MTKDEALNMAYKAEETGNLQDLIDAVNALMEALEQQEIGDAEIKEMLDDIEWYQQEQRKLIDRIKALEQPAQTYIVNNTAGTQFNLYEQPAQGIELEWYNKGWTDANWEWIGLTDDEVLKIYMDNNEIESYNDADVIKLYRDFEQALKDKNHG